MKFETGFGKGIVSLVFQKILEGKFGVKFADFTVYDFDIRTPVDGRNVHFNINVSGDINKGDIIKIIQKGEKNG